MRFILEQNSLIPEPLVATRDDPRLLAISSIEHLPQQKFDPTYSYSKELQSLLLGKQLLLEDIPRTIEELHQHYLAGYIQYRKGIDNNICNRCGNIDDKLFASFSCARCHTICKYCRKCIVMGRVSECTPLVSWIGPEEVNLACGEVLTWEGTLSEGQSHASNAIVETVRDGGKLLIWAVCGAGKTEILFEGLEMALKLNKKVCITTPRTDVVIELFPRIQKAFSNVEVIALYGGSEDRMKNAPLTLSTTHQLLRYYKAFDLVIIDEVDAFPYSVEPMLMYAVDQAKKETATSIYLTATPNSKWQKEIAHGKRRAVTIPARYHRKPLPVPTFTWCGDWQKKITKGKLPHHLLQWVNKHLLTKKQAFLFVPKIQYLNQIVKILKRIDARIEGVYAEDATRKEKVLHFRHGDIPILVTTTILERGVTVPNIDVAVLGAEDKIFTESALVQISGRVGRSAEFPTGEIIFYHYGKTVQMVKAKRHIERMNKQAYDRGLLD